MKKISYRRIYPVKMIIITVLLVGEVLFFTVGPSFAFGLFFGVLASLTVKFINFRYYRRLFREYNEKDRSEVNVESRGRKRGILKYVIYGGSLAVAAVIPYVSFYTAAGGLLVPRFSLQVQYLLKSRWGLDDPTSGR